MKNYELQQGIGIQQSWLVIGGENLNKYWSIHSPRAGVGRPKDCLCRPEIQTSLKRMHRAHWMLRSAQALCQQDSLRNSSLGCRGGVGAVHGEVPVLLAAGSITSLCALGQGLQKSHAAGGCPREHTGTWRASAFLLQRSFSCHY